MSKRIAYYVLHYGKEYLAWSIRSVQESVSEIHILYTDQPSFGHRTTLACPDTEAELKEEAHRFLKKPLIWHSGRWGQEGAHRGEIEKIARDRGAELVLVVDADEIWAPGLAESALESVWSNNGARSTLVRMIHFWRSLSWVCKDPAMPSRVLDLRHPPGTIWYLDPQAHPVYHAGYAQSEDVTKYKWEIHGHQNELRKDWLQQKFLGWDPNIVDVHPTCAKGFWTPEQTDPQTLTELEKVLGDHPYWGKEIIR